MSFKEKGWRGATFEYVSERAGVTRGALNHHFPDKKTLLIEALEWGWSEYEERLFADVDEQTPKNASAMLNGLLTHYVRLLISDARFRALASTTVLVAPQALGHSEQNNALDSWHERIDGTLRASGSHDGTVLGTSRIASLTLVLLQGFTVTAVTRPHDLPHPDDLEAAIAALVKGLLH